MPGFLANENAPREAVLAARAAGFDVTWMVELQPGAGDEIVLALAQQEQRVLITFDKDFGELVFRHGAQVRPASFSSARVCVLPRSSARSSWRFFHNPSTGPATSPSPAKAPSASSRCL